MSRPGQVDIGKQMAIPSTKTEESKAKRDSRPISPALVRYVKSPSLDDPFWAEGYDAKINSKYLISELDDLQTRMQEPRRT